MTMCDFYFFYSSFVNVAIRIYRRSKKVDGYDKFENDAWFSFSIAASVYAYNIINSTNGSISIL